MADSAFSTGLPGLDRVLRGLLPGDNVIFNIESREDYRAFVLPYCRHALKLGQRPVYFHFAPEPLITPEEVDVEVCRIDLDSGFETIIREIHRVIEANAPGGYYVFDCLSHLADAWLSDQMLANFFVLTCPYLYDVHALAYFALRTNYHSPHASEPIGSTAQVLIDVYRHHERLYVQPTKVQQRQSPTMYMLHAWHNDEFEPVKESAMNSEVLTSGEAGGLEGVTARLGPFHRAFVQAEDIWKAVQRGDAREQKADGCARALLERIVTSDERLLKLCQEYMSLGDVLDIQRRMIGTGQIGGKAEGMLLARAILRRTNPQWERILEAHDSFFIGSDVFYTFLVRNGCWRDRMRHGGMEALLRYAAGARQRILMGSFPDYVMQQFSDMLDYYGQSPIIVRSSSLLEDSFGHSFTGKYDSVFCANQGARSRRLEDFLNAVRTVYASCMSEKALSYRARRGLLEHDEQMALLIQRVSGSVHGDWFYPQLAGVGFSYNSYVWNKDIDPDAGVVRLVFGMGTRAVDRHEDDYTRVISLNAPNLRPESGFEEVRMHTQRHMDALDMEANLLVSADVADVAAQEESPDLDLFVSPDETARRVAAERGRRARFPYVLTFDRLINETDFISDLRGMLQTLDEGYGNPVDVEFTANFFKQSGYRINLVQCRPYLVRRETGTPAPMPEVSDRSEIVLEASGAVIGPSRSVPIERLICVSPSRYGQLPVAERYQVARLVGQAVRASQATGIGGIMLIGPGRWGTSTPSLGVPVRFAEVAGVSVLCEIVTMTEDVVPEVSLGAHFFNELVEMDILYLALFPGRAENFLNEAFIDAQPNHIEKLAPGAGPHADVLRVVDSADLTGREIQLHANALEQRVTCRLKNRDGE